MTLDVCIHRLFTEGAVVVANEVIPFSVEEGEATERILLQKYIETGYETPGEAPDFHPQAAMWAAQYFYRAVQLVMLRSLGEEKVKELLPEFEGKKTAEAMYSVDLVFQHLPDLLSLAKGLAPDDPLVIQLKKALSDWPLSSVGSEPFEDSDLSVLLSHNAVRRLFIDRILLHKDSKRAKNPLLQPFILEALGAHASTLWPSFDMTLITIS